MKLISILIFCLCFAGCFKENQNVLDIYWGTAAAEFNGEARTFMPFCDTDGLYLNLILDSYSDAGKLVYHLNLGHIRDQVYNVDSLAAYNSTGQNISEWTNLVSLISNGEIVGNIYKPLESEENSLEITDWNPINKEIKGKYKMTYVLDPDWPVNDPAAPDTIRLLNGVFYTRV